MQETLQKLQALQGGALGASEEQKARRMKAATAAAEEITMSLGMKSTSEPLPGLEEKRDSDKKEAENDSTEKAEKGSNTAMGVVIHWSGIRGFGILRSQTHGEVIVHAKALMNTGELAVGDVVTFELGFDKKKNKPEANNVYKSGAGGQKPNDGGRTSTSSSGPGTGPPDSDPGNGLSKGDAAKGAAGVKQLNETPKDKTKDSAGSKKEKRKSRSRRKSSSSSSSSSRKRRRRSRSRSRSRGRRRR